MPPQAAQNKEENNMKLHRKHTLWLLTLLLSLVLLPAFSTGALAAEGTYVTAYTDASGTHHIYSGGQTKLDGFALGDVILKGTTVVNDGYGWFLNKDVWSDYDSGAGPECGGFKNLLTNGRSYTFAFDAKIIYYHDFEGQNKADVLVASEVVNLAGAEISGSPFTYDGSAFFPTVTAGGTALTKGEAFVVGSGDDSRTNAGSYATTIYARNNDANYDTSAVNGANCKYYGSKAFEWSISKATITPTVTMADWTYGEKENDPSVTGNTGSGAVTYEYKVSGENDDTYTTAKPSVAGTYTVRATVAETANYYGDTATADFTIAPRAEEEAPKFTSHRMVLTSEIGLQFRVAFPDSFDAEGCYVNFVVSDGRNFDVQYEDAQSVPGSTTDKYFNCPLNALELADTVTATLHYGAGQEKTNTYSAMTYFNAARGLNTPVLTNLVSSLQDLGHYIGAAEWTDNNTPHAAIAAMSTPSVDTATAGVSEKDVTCDNGNLAEVKVSLTLAENTVINLYVKPAAGVTITNYKGTKTIDEETYYLIQSDKFGPKLLGTDQNIIVETSAGETTVSVSAMAYVNKGLSAESTMTPAQKTALAAFYNYFVAAYAYE